MAQMLPLMIPVDVEPGDERLRQTERGNMLNLQWSAYRLGVTSQITGLAQPSRAKYFFVFQIALLFFALSAIIPRPVSAGGSVGLWNFDEGVGLIANDYSGNNNAGALVNEPQWAIGKFGTALSFDDIDDYVEIAHADSLNISRELTVSAWIYNKATKDPSLPQSKYHVIAAKGWAPDRDGSWTLGWDRKTNALFFCARKNTNNAVKCASFDSGNLADDWHLITAVFNDGKIRLYADGVLAAGPVNLGTAKIESNTENVYIGGLPSSDGNSNESWYGLIDEVQISNVALTPMEVAASAGMTNSGGNFDFSLSRPADLSVGQASTATTSINTVLLSGTPKTVSFSLSGLPANTSASFSVTGCSPSCSTILTIKPASTPLGTYPVMVTAKARGIQKRASFNLLIVQSTVSTVATPIITPSGGTFTGPVPISMQDSTSGASIYYTTDGSSPTQSSTLYYDGAISLTKSAVIKAKAFKTGYTPSSEASASLTVTQPFDFSLANSGAVSVAAGASVSNTVNATLSTGNSQAITFSVSGLPSGSVGSFSSSSSCSPTCSRVLTITTSGSTPAGNFPITVTSSGGGMTRTTAFILSVTVPVSLVVATPTITPNGGTFAESVSISMATATAGASIYYTTDGSTPSQSSTPYTGAMMLASSTVVTSKAFKSGYSASAEASATFTMANPSKAQCSHYASPTGTGNGLSPASPFRLSNFWKVAGPGQTLCLLDGTYTGSASMIVPPSGLSGTASSPITIKAVNDGRVTINGQGTEWPVYLGGVNYFVLEGFNAHSSGMATQSVVRIVGSSRITVRRVAAWDSADEPNGNSAIISVGTSEYVLFEDVAAWGAARKIYTMSQGGNFVTCRRCWGRWERSVSTGPKHTYSLAYNNYDMTIENSIGTWNGTAQNGQGIFSNDVSFTDTRHRSKILGSIAYLRGADSYMNGMPLVFLHDTTSTEIRDTVAYIEPGTHLTNWTFLLRPTSPTDSLPVNNFARNLTGIGGGSPADVSSQWQPSNIAQGSTVQSIGSVFSGTGGAKVCTRYKDGVLTSEPLWPWPMNQRILDAMVQSGRTAVDVTGTIEQIFGPIPNQCKS